MEIIREINSDKKVKSGEDAEWFAEIRNQDREFLAVLGLNHSNTTFREIVIGGTSESLIDPKLFKSY